MKTLVSDRRRRNRIAFRYPVVWSFAIGIGVALGLSVLWSSAYWGYALRAPTPLREIHRYARIRNIVAVHMDGTTAGRFLPKGGIEEVESFAAASDRYGDRQSAYHAAAVIRDLGLLRAAPSVELGDLAELPSRFKATGLLAEDDPGYESFGVLDGICIDGFDADGNSQIYLNLRGGEVSNDHYPRYEFLFRRDPAGLAYVRGQRFFFDAAGIEGAEWYVVAPFIACVTVPWAMFVVAVWRRTSMAAFGRDG